jgi:hypothetical protein
MALMLDRLGSDHIEIGSRCPSCYRKLRVCIFLCSDECLTCGYGVNQLCRDAGKHAWRTGCLHYTLTVISSRRSIWQAPLGIDL